MARMQVPVQHNFIVWAESRKEAWEIADNLVTLIQDRAIPGVRIGVEPSTRSGFNIYWIGVPA